MFCNYKRFSRSLENCIRFKPIYFLVWICCSLVYSVYMVSIYLVIALISLVIGLLIFALTYAVLIVPSYFIFLIVVVRKQFVWSQETQANPQKQDHPVDNEALNN